MKLTKNEIKYLTLHKTLKLQIELVPSSCWFKNIKSIVEEEVWDGIRKQIYKKANYHCEICGEKGTAYPVACHEVWLYDDDNLIQKLGFFQAVCPACHEVKHIGLAGLNGNGEIAFNRFKKINNLKTEIAKKIVLAIFKETKIRSQQKWKTDINLLKDYGIDLVKLKNNIKKKQAHSAAK